MNYDCLWHTPPKQLLLPMDEAHVWRASLHQPEAVFQLLQKTLSADEVERAARFHFERDRRRYIIGRGILRAILAGYLNRPPGDIQFSYGPQNKPALAAASPKNNLSRKRTYLQFNLSHSHDQALYAFARRREVGVDLEQLRPLPDRDDIAGRFFSARENTIFQALPPLQREEGFFNCWTRKEAYIKALGDGLAHPLGDFDVTLRPGEPAVLLAVKRSPDEVSRWSMRALTPFPGYVAALVVEGHDWRLQCWDWGAPGGPP